MAPRGSFSGMPLASLTRAFASASPCQFPWAIMDVMDILEPMKRCIKLGIRRVEIALTSCY